MSDLKAFAMECRDWLETNCPAEMRKPVESEKDICWGGRNWTYSSKAQEQWLERMAAKGWTVPTWPRNMAGQACHALRKLFLRKK